MDNSGRISALREQLRGGADPYAQAMYTGEKPGDFRSVFEKRRRCFPDGRRCRFDVVHSGEIDVSSETVGGEVVLSGNTVDVQSTAEINATGNLGGGSVSIGGGFQGQDESIPNAEITRIQEGAVVDASATEQGDGGSVIVWSDGATIYSGEIRARGAGDGDGGFAEVSGKEFLAFEGSVDLLAPLGVRGDLLLDPASIRVVATGPDIDGMVSPATDDIDDAMDLDDANADFTLTQDSIITAGEVENLLDMANLTLAATDSISVEAALEWGADADAGILSLEASNILIDAPITAGSGGVEFIFGNNVPLVGSPGSLTLNADVTGSFLSGMGGSSDNSLVVNAALSNPFSVDLGAGTNSLTSSETVALTGAANEVTAGMVTVTNLDTLDVSVTSLTGSGLGDAFVLTSANTGTVAGISFSGLNSVTGGTGTDSVASAGPVNVTAANAATVSEIDFTGIETVDATGATDSLSSSESVSLTANNNQVSTGSITVSNLESLDISVAALTGSNTGDDFVLSGANTGTANLIAFTGLDTVTGGFGLDDLSLTGGNDTLNVTAVNAANSNGVAFTGIESVTASVGGTDQLNNSSGQAFLAESNSVAGISVAEFESVNTSLLSLTNLEDTFEVTAAGNGLFDGVSFTGLTSVDGLAGADTLVSNQGVSLTGINNQAVSGKYYSQQFRGS